MTGMMISDSADHATATPTRRVPPAACPMPGCGETKHRDYDLDVPDDSPYAGEGRRVFECGLKWEEADGRMSFYSHHEKDVAVIHMIRALKNTDTPFTKYMDFSTGQELA